MSRILIVEDELVIRAALKRLLEKHSYTVDDAGSVAEALPLTAKHHYDLIISDLRLPGAQGTDLIAHAGTTPVLIMTSYASMRSAIDAIKMGAAEYIAKPFSHEEMLAVIAKLIQPDETEAPAPNIIKPLLNGSCEPIQDLIRRINKIASTNATVLILGESGTGKELAAKKHSSTKLQSGLSHGLRQLRGHSGNID